MLFTTAPFAFVYLPVLLIGFFAIARASHLAAAAWVFAASVFFYGYWMPEFTLLLLASVALNFFVGMRITEARRGAEERRRFGKYWLVAGVVVNLALLGYFKYANFFVTTVGAMLGLEFHAAKILLLRRGPFACGFRPLAL